MTSSKSSSSSLAALLLLAVACAGAPPRRGGPAARVAVLPVENLSGGVVPARAIQEAMELAVARAGVEVVGGELLERFLMQHWIRYTGGVDAETSRAARDELGVDALLLVSAGLYAPGPPPRIALSARLVATGDRPRILWVDGAYRWGDESPGLLNLGVVNDMNQLRGSALRQLSEHVGAFLQSGKTPPDACPPGRKFRPQIQFLAHRAPAPRTLSVMVLPFVSRGARPGSAQAVATELVEALEASGRFEVVEPGLVRDELLRNRIIFQGGGVSLDNILPVLAELQADLIMTGTVYDYEDGEQAGAVKVAFSTLLLDRESGRTVWMGTSSNGGLDGETLFGKGRIRTAAALACRMASSAAAQMAEAAGSPARR